MVFSNEKVLDVIDECYRRMYKKSEPVGNIDKIKSSGEGKMPNFFMAYYLDQKTQNKIMYDAIKEFKVPSIQISMICNSVVLGASPCSNKETSIEYRETHDERLRIHTRKNKIHKI